MKDLWGRTALITGASKGIGVYVARSLAVEGMNLVLAARSASLLEEVRDQVERLHRKAVVLPIDLSDRAQLRTLAEMAETAFGGIDVLVNNAGLELVYQYDKLSEEEIDQVVQVNLLAPMQLTRLMLPKMLERNRGHIVNMASLAGKYGIGYNEVYATTKAGLITFTQSLRSSYAGTGVTASVICPGFVDTGMYTRGVEESGVVAPKSVGVSKPEAVAMAVIRAIREDVPEIIVNPRPLRPLIALGAALPGVADGVVRRLGVDDGFRKYAAWQEANGGVHN